MMKEPSSHSTFFKNDGPKRIRSAIENVGVCRFGSMEATAEVAFLVFDEELMYLPRYR